MNILLLGAAGFIGTNLAIELAKNKNNRITVVDRKREYFSALKSLKLDNIFFAERAFDADMNFDSIIQGQKTIYHLVSTTIPGTSNRHISQEFMANVVFSANLFDACIRCGVEKIVFISSGGTVYGRKAECPLNEKTATNPISSYGVQKITIEKLLYLYEYMYGLDFRTIRLANPYGPYQRPNGVLGAITTFTYKALKNEEIVIYGDGSVVRDFIYIDDVVRAIVKIADGESRYHTFNVGSGYGTSINEALDIIKKTLNTELKVTYKEGRKTDVPVNYLDISRYEKCYGILNPIRLNEGVKKTAEFMKDFYKI